jgi:AmmeMemoRadiSam system protein B/AmmeMemoRadiSam system protein A
MKRVMVLIMVLWNSFASGQSREPYVAGKFYPADKQVLTNYLEELFKEAKVPTFTNRVRAIIVPHAGYVYSGKVAAHGFAVLQNQKKYKNVFLLGGSHVAAFDGASVYVGDAWKTPLGTVPVNKKIAEELRKIDVFKMDNSPHVTEHSLEVEIPFLQYVLKDSFNIVPISIGTHDHRSLKKIASALQSYFTEENLFVISTDLSHYPPYNDAVRMDSLVINSILSGDPEKFASQVAENENSNVPNYLTAICGYSATYVLLHLVKNSGNLTLQKLYYANSGDVSYDHQRVVGYVAIAITENDQKSEKAEFIFTEEEKKLMFAIARSAIESVLFNKPMSDFSSKLTPRLQEKCGVFVTLKIDNKLRGCIGTFRQDKPLWQNIKEMAVAAAFHDTRFLPLTKEEYAQVKLEISVLTPMRKISSIDEIELGKHGIYIKKGWLSGTFLPQVATEQGWTKEEFLGHCARDKAGIGWDGWKDAEIYIYEAIVIEE